MSPKSNNEQIREQLADWLQALLIINYRYIKQKVADGVWPPQGGKNVPGTIKTCSAKYAEKHGGYVHFEVDCPEGKFYGGWGAFTPRVKAIAEKIRKMYPSVSRFKGYQLEAKLDHEPGVGEMAWAEEKLAVWNVSDSYGTYKIAMRVPVAHVVKHGNIVAASPEDAIRQAREHWFGRDGWHPDRDVAPEDMEVVKCELEGEEKKAA